MNTNWEDWSKRWENWDIQKSPAPVRPPELLWHPDHPENPDEIEEARNHALSGQWSNIKKILDDGDGFRRLLTVKDQLANYLNQTTTKIDALNDEIEILGFLSRRYEQLSGTSQFSENRKEKRPIGLHFLSNSESEGLTVRTDNLNPSWQLYHPSTGSFYPQTKWILKKGISELSFSDFAVLYRSRPEADDYVECDPDVYSGFVEDGLDTFRASRPCPEIVADMQIATDGKTEPLLVLHRTEAFLRFRLDLIEAAVYRVSLFGEIGSAPALEVKDTPPGVSSLDHERTIKIGNRLKDYRLKKGSYPTFDAYGDLRDWAGEVILMSDYTARKALVETNCWVNRRQGETEGLRQTMRNAEQYAERYESNR